MAKPGVLVVRLLADDGDLQKGLDRSGKAVQSTGDKFAAAGKKMTLFATVPIVGAMGLATKAASNLEQSMGAVQSIFGSAAGPVLEFGEQAAESAGLSKREVNEMAAVLGASLQGMGFEAGASAEKVVELQKRGADMAATFGGTTKDALDAIASLMRGERDPIEKYGVSIKAVDVSARIAAMGLDTSTAAAKKNAEAVAGLDLLMEQTAKTQGQFAREADSTAGSQQRAKAAIENAAASIGEHLLPMAARAAGGIADLAEGFGKLPGPVQNAVLALAGIAAATGPILTVAGSVLKLKAAVQGLNTAQATSGLLTFGKAAGVAALGVGAAIGTYKLLDATLGGAPKDWGKSLDLFRDALVASNGALDDNVRAAMLAALEAEGMTEAFADAGVTVDDLHAAVSDAAASIRDLDDPTGRDAVHALTKRVTELGGELSDTDKRRLQGFVNTMFLAKAESSKLTTVLGGTTAATTALGDATDDATEALERRAASTVPFGRIAGQSRKDRRRARHAA